MTPRRTRSALVAAALGFATALTAQAQQPAAAASQDFQKQLEALQHR